MGPENGRRESMLSLIRGPNLSLSPPLRQRPTKHGTRKLPAATQPQTPAGLTGSLNPALLHPPVTSNPLQLAYCTNIHPAETWEETFHSLAKHALQVRKLLEVEDLPDFLSPFPLAPRLSARAARELLSGDQLPRFRDWLREHNSAVFTINGFPFGAFHGTRVKENVYRPDWTEPARLDYTRDLFSILSVLLPPDAEGSVSTLPGSFKAFHADESAIICNLISLAAEIEKLSEQTGHELHLGLEPEPLGHFENTDETIAFFSRLANAASDPEMVRRRIGLNYDTCHFAIEYNDCYDSLTAMAAAGIRISKVHLSNAIALDPRNPDAVRAIAAFDETTYLHQVIARQADGTVIRFPDLGPAFEALTACEGSCADEWRVHFHIPLDAEPAMPLRSTRDHVLNLLAYRRLHPDFCHHFEIETYTWSVLPSNLQRPINEQLAAEYRWVLAHL